MNKKLLPFLALILSGEAIFMLPFLIPRIFKPLMIDSWNLTNTDIGLAFTAYGLFSILSYFFRWNDRYSSDYPGALGFSYVFSFTGAFLLLGSIAAFILYKRV